MNLNNLLLAFTILFLCSCNDKNTCDRNVPASLDINITCHQDNNTSFYEIESNVNPVCRFESFGIDYNFENEPSQWTPINKLISESTKKIQQESRLDIQICFKYREINKIKCIPFDIRRKLEGQDCIF